ncbi:hypothetical protein [Pseudonocardia sp. HH130630-07]|uniref:hypothetical protein n=1 Tax=Pseudonocardia sp. HH130630-07 TaxID=1690815 RepID=UPI0008151CD2|nr:hypothetical protein [Pseudonocardia sp. HH130630-07]ANY05536.1 hypothetical protein AFB00_03580 [Pseudonocardia sp. HH130630-07]
MMATPGRERVRVWQPAQNTADGQHPRPADLAPGRVGIGLAWVAVAVGQRVSRRPQGPGTGVVTGSAAGAR